MMKKLLVPLFTIGMAIAAMVGIQNSKPEETFALENSGDGFELTEINKASNESFVYTAVANFESGQACGLVFGASQDQIYWVFNVDRYENKTKLMRFGRTGPTDWDVRVLREEPFIGNNKTVDSEYNVISSELNSCPQFNFKVVITIQDTHAYAEFYLDNIRRFFLDANTGADLDPIDLNTLISNVSYTGGYLGFNVFNANVNFTDVNVGNSDYAYYTELYRNQYHYSQYAHWNNDPNGLVYYNGWYHMYYQTHPFNQQWGAMYWGHARSRDLIHWQELPIALFPDDGTMGKGLGVGYAWSGIAMVYRPGMSDEIDSRNWFPNGSGTGLLGYYTRDGERQDQIIISSDDGGITWTKQELISQHIVHDGEKIDCRDPSIFPVKKEGNHVTLWGMVLSGANYNKYWFLKSEDLINWSFAGEQDYIYPECMSVSKVKADDDEEHHVITVSSRDYTVGDFVYNEGTGNIDFILIDGRNIREVPQNEAFRVMEYGEDSYAAQPFYIDDNASDYYDKVISINWYSGLPSDAESGVYANVRKPWNGGGMTIPVELGLKKVGEGYNLTQTPITLNNDDLEREATPLVNISEDLVYNNTNDPLAVINSHLIEIQANIQNNDEHDVEFKVNLSSNEYTSFGWTKTEGYFFDRTHTSKAGIGFAKNYVHRFTTGPVDGKNLSFYVLVDNGGLELFCGDFQYAFYNLTLANPYSIGASLTTSGEVTIKTLKVQQIKSIWHDKSDLDKGVLYLETDNVELDLTLGQSKEVMAYSSNDSDIYWEITSGEEHISLVETVAGAKITGVSNGDAVVTVTSGDNVKTINVTVDDAEINCDLDLKASDIYSGEWLSTSAGLVAKQNQGDGFIISDKTGSDFTYAATFNISNADAAGLLLRASKDMSSYIMVNYDKIGNVCKIWSPNGEIGRVNVSNVDPANVALSVRTSGKNIDLYLNGSLVLSVTAKNSDPLDGYYGLNVCSGKAIINDVVIIKSEYEYANADLTITCGTEQYVSAIYNFTNKNTLVDSSYYHVDGANIIIHKEYFDSLEANKTYTFFIEGEQVPFNVKVVVGEIQKSELTFENTKIKEGEALNVYLGAHALETVLINGETADSSLYELKGNVLHFDANNFTVGTYTITINGVAFTLEVASVLEVLPEPTAIKVTAMPTKTEYEIGETLDLTGLVVSLLYDDDSSEVITEYTVAGFDSSAAGTVTITVTYENFTATFTLKIKEAVTPDPDPEPEPEPEPVKELVSISVTTTPSKTVYEIGDVLDLTGLILTATYSDGSTEVVTDYTTSGFNSSTAGTTTVTITYEDLTTSIDLIIKEAPEPEPEPVVEIVYIEITTMPTKMSYEIGEELDLTGLVLTATYSDGTTTVLTDFEVTGFDSSKAGVCVVTIKSGDFTVSFGLTIKKETLTGIEITSTPDKTDYKAGEEIDLTGLVITGSYSNNTTAEISDYKVSGFDPNKVGEQTITVSYGGYKATFTINVEAVKKGCGGSITASVALISITSLAAFSLMMFKKRKDD